MNAPFENQKRVAGVEEFGRRSPHEAVTTPSKDDILARLDRLLAQREGPCESVVEPQRPLPLRAREGGEGLRDRAILDKLGATLRTDCAAIEAEAGVMNARLHKPWASWKTATSNALPDSIDGLKTSRHKVETSIEAEAGVMNARPHSPRASWKAATSNALPDSTDQARTVACDPLGVVDRRHAPPRIYLMAAVVILGLVGLSAGMAFWNSAPDWVGASKTEAELAEAPSQVAARADVPAHSAVMVGPWPSALSGEQTSDSPQPQAEARSAIAPVGESGPTNQTASAPKPPTPTLTQGAPVGIMAPLGSRKEETFSTAPLNGANPRFEAPPEATAKLLSPQSLASVAPPSSPKKAARTPKTNTAGLDNRRHEEPIVKPASAPMNTAPENDGLFPNLKGAQETVDSLQQVVPPESTAQAPAADKAAYGEGAAAAAEAAAVAPPPAAKALAAVELPAPPSAPPTSEGPVADPTKSANKSTKPAADKSDDRSEKREPRSNRHAKAKPTTIAKPHSAADAPAQANADPDAFSHAVESMTGAVKSWAGLDDAHP